MYTMPAIEKKQPIEVEVCEKDTCIKATVPANNGNAFLVGLGYGVVSTLIVVVMVNALTKGSQK